MKHLRLKITPTKRTIHPVFSLVADRDFVANAQLVHWNIVDSDRPMVLFVIEGDRELFAAELTDLPKVTDFDLTPIDADRFSVHIRPEPTDVIRDMIAMHVHEDILLLHPVDYRNGSAYTSVIGTPASLQTALDSAPSGVHVEVEQVGEYDTDQGSIASVLSDRQREAVEMGLALGYYEVPRQATHEDIAARIDCAPNTASEHIQKAEAKLIAAVMG